MHNHPIVSIIIPTDCKRTAVLLRALRSITQQTYRNFHVVVVDDSDSCEVSNLIQSLEDQRIVCIKIAKPTCKSPVCKKRNVGIENVLEHAKYISFLDDDDEFMPEFLAKCIAFLEANPDYGLASSWVDFRTQDGKKLKTKRVDISNFWDTPVGNMWVLRKDICYKDNVRFDDNVIFDDLDFGIHIPLKYKRYIIPEVLRIYYAYPSKRGASFSTKYEWLASNLMYFYDKNKSIYLNAGDHAYAFLNFITGKTYCQANELDKGKLYLKKSLKYHCKLRYLIYWFFAFFYPGLFKNHSLIILKHRLLKNLF